MQILNVALGGTLCMDVPSLPVPKGKVHWRHLPILHDPAHPIAVEDGSLLSRVLDWQGEVQVNSSHHCCVDKLGKGVQMCIRDSPRAVLWRVQGFPRPLRCR